MVGRDVLTPNTTRASTRGQDGFRAPEPGDGPEIWALARRVGLDVNSPYAYVMWGDHFADTSLVAVRRGSVAAFTLGFLLPASPRDLFIWQIGVDEGHRGSGLAGRMLDTLVASTGAATVEATVTPSNAASAALFRGLAARHGGTAQEGLAYGEDLFPPGHEAEIRFRIPVRGEPSTRH